MTLRFSIMLAALFCSMYSNNVEAQALYEWQNGKRHSFCKNFQAGTDLFGRPLYISQREIHVLGGGSYIIEENWNCSRENWSICGRIEVREGPTFPDTFEWHIGKAGAHLSQGMSYTFHGKEYATNEEPGDAVRSLLNRMNANFHHSVFCLTEAGQDLHNKFEVFRWKKWNGSLPISAVPGFNRAEKQYVCRAEHFDQTHGWSLHPGKHLSGQPGCLIGYAGREIGKPEFEILYLDFTAMQEYYRDTSLYEPSVWIFFF